MDDQEIKIVVSWSGMLMARFPDGSFAPIKADKNGYIYVERYENDV